MDLESRLDVVTNPRKWMADDQFTDEDPVDFYIGEEVNHSTVSFQKYEPIDGCRYNGSQLYRVRKEVD